MPYCSKEDIENYLLVNIDASFDEQLEAWNAYAKEYIDRATNRTFGADEYAEARVFSGNGTGVLRLPEFVELESVVVDSIDITSDVLSEPANDETKRKIISRTKMFSKGMQNVTVTARWGRGEEVPLAIKFAATVIVAGIINNSNQHEGEVASESIGRYTVTYKQGKDQNDFESVKELLSTYRRTIL